MECVDAIETNLNGYGDAKIFQTSTGRQECVNGISTGRYVFLVIKHVLN